MDMTMQMFGAARDLFSAEDMQKNPLGFMEKLDGMFLGAYDILGRLEDVPLTTEFFSMQPQTVAPFDRIFNLAYQSGSVGYSLGIPGIMLPQRLFPPPNAGRSLRRREGG